jgi:hypothetical protein
MPRKDQKDPSQWRTAAFEEKPPGSGQFWVVDDGGWVRFAGPYARVHLAMLRDTMVAQHGEHPAGGGEWIHVAGEALPPGPGAEG